MASLTPKKHFPQRLKYLLLLLPLVFLCLKRYVALRHPTLSGPPRESYNLPHLLSIPTFLQSASPPDLPSRVACLARDYPTSLLARYAAIPSSCARQPYPPHLRQALAEWRQGRRSVAYEQVARRDDTLTLLVESHPAQGRARSSLTSKFVKQAVHRARYFANVLLVVNLADAADVKDARRDAKYMRKALRKARVRVTLHSSVGVDDDVYLFHAARNLMVHKGDMSALAAIVCDGTVYYTPLLDKYIKQNQFKWMIKNGRPAADTPETVTTSMWRAMGPVKPSCCRFEGYGHGDGQKILCANSKTFTSDGCWVLSLGCAGKWSFEMDIVKRTNCKIHTFDCTGSWAIPEELQGRVTLHKTCLGKDDDPRGNFAGWSQVVAMGATEGAKKMPAAVKMDIEGAEFPVLLELLSQGDESLLPQQLAVEMHAYKAPLRDMENLFANFTRRGYSLTHRADNPYCSHCTEITLSRDTDLPDVFEGDGADAR